MFAVTEAAGYRSFEMNRLPIAIGLTLAVIAISLGVAIAASSGTDSGQAPRPKAPALAGTTAKTTHLRSRSWRLGAVRSHGRVVVIQYAEGDCWVGGRSQVSQTKTAVTIELLQAYTGGTGVACPQFLIIRTLSVHLQAPLGRRRLLHAPVGAPTIR